jgi:hypothetical protein
MSGIVEIKCKFFLTVGSILGRVQAYKMAGCKLGRPRFITLQRITRNVKYDENRKRIFLIRSVSPVHKA